MDYPIGATVAGAGVGLVSTTLLAGRLMRWGFPLPAAGSRIGCMRRSARILALFVLIHHFIIWMQVTRLGGTWSAPTVDAFNQLGAAAVALFFMTTGLVFYPRIRQGFRRASWRSVYVSRVFRIVPLVMVSVAAVTALVVIRTGHDLDSAYPAAALSWVLTLGEPPLLGYPDSGQINAYVLWSLRYEWEFYLIALPACAIAVDILARWVPTWTVPVGLILLALVGRILHVPIELLLFLPLFGMGMLALRIQRIEQLAFAAAYARSRAYEFRGACAGGDLLPTPYGLAMPLLGLFFTCAACGNRFGGILDTNGALVLGECSFGIYLLHGIILSLLFVECAPILSILPTWALPFAMPVAFLGVLVITPATYLLVERPAIDAGRAVSRLLASKPASGRTAEVAP